MTKRIGTVSLIFAIFFGILTCFFLYTTKARTEERNSYRQQLIAVCGVTDEVLRINEPSMPDFKNLTIFPRWEHEKKPAVCIAVKEGESTYTVLYDGRIIIRIPGGWEGQIIEKDWKDYPKFSEIGKN